MMNTAMDTSTDKKKPMTKKQAIEKCIKNLQGYLITQGLTTQKHLNAVIKEYKITTPKVVAYLENFFMKPYQANMLEAYVAQEIMKGKFLFLKYQKLARSDKIKTALGQYAEKKITPGQLKVVVRRLKQILDILLLNTPAKKQKLA